MELTLPCLSNVVQEREQLKATSERERAASEQLPALRARYDELQKSRIALESACIMEQDNERRLDDEKRDSNRRLRDAQNHLQKFAGAATKPVCDLCGQEITGEYAKQEQFRLQQRVEECRREVTAVTQQHQDAVDLKNAKERELKELDDQIGEVRGSYGQAEHEQQTAYEQAKDHEKRLRAAFEAMSERYRERISGALPEDRAAWLATSYPLTSDITSLLLRARSSSVSLSRQRRLLRKLKMRLLAFMSRHSIARTSYVRKQRAERKRSVCSGSERAVYRYHGGAGPTRLRRVV